MDLDLSGLDAIIAARLSHKVRGHAQSGIESQDEDARDFATEHGCNVIETIADHASGSKPMWERPNLKLWVTDPFLMSKYQVIIAAKQDRLGREDWSGEVEMRKWAEKNRKILVIVDRNLRWPPRPNHYEDDVEAWNRGAEAARREWAETSKRYKRMGKRLRDNNFLTGRAPYGYRVKGVNCGEMPCRCAEKQIGDHKTLGIYEPEAAVIREARDRYLNGDTLEVLCNDFNARGVPSPMYRGKPGTNWITTTLSDVLRNPSTAGRRMDNWKGPEHERKTILKFDGVLTWAEHEQIIKLMDSRAYRKGIASANVYLLSGLIFDEAGHPLYHNKGNRDRTDYYRCHLRCSLSVEMDEADRAVSDTVIQLYGAFPHMVRRVIPGKTNFETIAKLRQDRNELDDTQPDYMTQHAAITAEITRLRLEDEHSPRPDEVKWVDSGSTIADYWEGLTIAHRRDWLKTNGWRVTVSKADRAVSMAIDPGHTEELTMIDQARSLGLVIEAL